MTSVLVTTTIHVPHGLALLRRADTTTPFIVIADEKTPREAYEFCATIPNCDIYAPQRQRELGYACSELIGWNCIQRRNIGFLEALKMGADAIISWDTDNLPMHMGPRYADEFRNRLGFNTVFGKKPALRVVSETGWFDVGTLLQPVAPHRGFPIGVSSDCTIRAAGEHKVGVSAGICLGDPDISAVTRIANAPIVHGVSELLRAGLVFDPAGDGNPQWTVFNSQNTAFVRELAPAMFMMPGVGRYDDIYASLVCQRVMRQHGYSVFFGPPFVWQQRNPHNLIKDLLQETLGMECVPGVAAALNEVKLFGATVFSDTHRIWSEMACVVPPQTRAAAQAWLSDISQVMP